MKLSELIKTGQLFYHRQSEDLYRAHFFPGHLPHQEKEDPMFRYFRAPDILGTSICQECGVLMHYHAFLDIPKQGKTICPGSYVMFPLDEEVCNEHTVSMISFDQLHNYGYMLR
jgi:hypothetical protein